MADNLRGKTISGFIYKMLERIGVQGVNFIVSIILARVLMPEEYGIVSLVTVFIAICDVFVTYGFGNSLVANKNSDTLDFSTCFFFGIAFSLVVYAGVFFAAPLMAQFYDNELLTPVIRVMALRVPIAAINSVQHAYVSKHMMFQKFFYSTSIATVISGILSIIMAYTGFGVWALVAQYVSNVVLATVSLWCIVGWRPSFVFSWQRLKKIYSYGWKILVVGLIDTGYNQVRNLVIAKKYTSEDLAYYNKGMQFPNLGMSVVEPTITGVIFPALSRCNDDYAYMRAVTRRVIKVSTYIIFPIMVGLFAVAEPLVQLLLTDKWMNSVIFLQIGCIAMMFRPIQFINNCVAKASGRSDLLLKLDVIKKGIGIALLIVSIPYGTVGIAISLMLSNFISATINILPNRKLLQYGYLQQIADVGINLLLALVMGVAVSLVRLLELSNIMTLVLQVIIGVTVYLSASALLKIDSFQYLVELCIEFLRKRNKI